jgi:excinuclease ABC subunit C
MVDRRGELIYVGKAKRLRARLLSYFRPKSRDKKAARIIAHTRTIVWEESPSELAALLRELEVIQRWQPCCNVQGQPKRRRRVFLCLGRRPAPYLFLSRRPPRGILAVFGPVPAAHTARSAVRWLNDWFGLRDCPRHQEMHFADQADLFAEPRAAGCLRYEIGTCLGPCAAAVTSAAYHARVEAARAFLTGANTSVLDDLERKMAVASASLHFEQAAMLRDQLTSLKWLCKLLERSRSALDKHSFVYPECGHDGQERWYLIRRARVAKVLPAPSDAAGRVQMAAILDEVYRARIDAIETDPATGFDEVFLIAGWLRRHPEERARLLSPAEASAELH